MGKEYKNKLSPARCVAFFDFDNTIARGDVFDDIIARFSKDRQWVRLEEQWRQGKIGSRACLEGQLRGVRIGRRALDRYLAGIKLDPYFKKLVALLNRKRTRVIILSDNFDYILRTILFRHGVRRVKIYANRLGFSSDRLLPSFPFTHRRCLVCGHCKKKNLLANSKEDFIIFYIGDGRSDICPAKYADIVFAKEDLLAHYRQEKAVCLPYNNLKDVYNYLK